MENKDKFKQYFLNSKDNEKNYFMLLYNLRDKIEKIYGEKNLQDALNELEDRIYTVNNKVIDDKEKIKLEYLRISTAKGNKNLNDENVNDILNDIYLIMNSKDIENELMLNYIKELILYLQIGMKLDITMFSAILYAITSVVFKIRDINK